AITAQSERTPWISRHPQPQTVAEGDTVDFTVDAEGEHPLEYQWQFNGEDLPGATNAILTLSAAAARHSGNYAVRVRHATADSLITVTSRAADLVVNNDRIFYGVLRREMYFDITEKSLGALTNHVRFPENPDSSDFIHRF